MNEFLKKFSNEMYFSTDLGQILFLYCWLVEYSLYKRVRATVKERNQSGQGTENGPESQQLN